MAKYLRTDEQKKLFKKIQDHVNYSAHTMQHKRDLWEQVWQLWVQDKNTDIPKFRSNFRIPLARQTVNTFAAFISARVPTFNVYPIGTEDWLKAQFSRELLQYQAAKPEILDLRRKAKILVKSACLFDVGIAKTGWYTSTVQEAVDGKKKKGVDIKVLSDIPTLENVHTLDFYPDPYVNRMQDQEIVVEQMVVFVDALKKDKRYSLPDDFKPTYKDGRSRTEDSSRLDSIDLTTGQGDEQTQGKVLLWECWTKSKVYTIADPFGEPCIIRDADNPYGFIPYVKMDFEVEPVPNRFYGYGMLTPNVDINKAIDGLINNIRDNMNIIINPMYKIRRGSRIDPRQLVSRPGGAIDVETMGDVEQLRTGDTTAPGLNMFNVMNAIYQQGTRVSSIRGGGGGNAETATEAEIQQQNADIVTNAVKDNFEQALSEIGTQILRINIQNLQGSSSIRIFNPELIEELNEKYQSDILTPLQKEEALATGQLNGFLLDDDMMEEIELYGRIKPEPLSEEDRNKIKTYGQLIKFSKKYIDVDADVMVEADSTVKKDSAVLRKQVNDIVNIVARVPNGVQMIDWPQFAATMADLSGIPAIKKLIKEPPEQPPQLPQGPERGLEGQGAPQPPQINQLNTDLGIRQSLRQ